MSDVFKNAVSSVSHPAATNKQEYIEYFRQQYGESAWRRQAAIQISGTTDSKSRAYQSAMRNFQGKREHQAGATPKWKGLGEELPRVMKKDHIIVTVHAKQKGNKGRPERDRTFNVEMSGARARDFVDKPTWGKVWDAYGFVFPVEGSDADDWGEDDPDFDYSIYDIDDMDYELTGVSVTAA